MKKDDAEGTSTRRRRRRGDSNSGEESHAHERSQIVTTRPATNTQIRRGIGRQDTPNENYGSPLSQTDPMTLFMTSLLSPSDRSGTHQSQLMAHQPPPPPPSSLSASSYDAPSPYSSSSHAVFPAFHHPNHLGRAEQQEPNADYVLHVQRNTTGALDTHQMQQRQYTPQSDEVNREELQQARMMTPFGFGQRQGFYGHPGPPPPPPPVLRPVFNSQHSGEARRSINNVQKKSKRENDAATVSGMRPFGNLPTYPAYSGYYQQHHHHASSSLPRPTVVFQPHSELRLLPMTAQPRPRAFSMEDSRSATRGRGRGRSHSSGAESTRRTVAETASVGTKKNANDKDKKKFGSSGYRGVSWHKRDKKWTARAWIHHKTVHLGAYVNEKIAAWAVDVKTVQSEPLRDPSKPLNFENHEARRNAFRSFLQDPQNQADIEMLCANVNLSDYYDLLREYGFSVRPRPMSHPSGFIPPNDDSAELGTISFPVPAPAPAPVSSSSNTGEDKQSSAPITKRKASDSPGALNKKSSVDRLKTSSTASSPPSGPDSEPSNNNNNITNQERQKDPSSETSGDGTFAEVTANGGAISPNTRSPSRDSFEFDRSFDVAAFGSPPQQSARHMVTVFQPGRATDDGSRSRKDSSVGSDDLEGVLAALESSGSSHGDSGSPGVKQISDNY